MKWAFAVLLVTTRVALAHPPPPPDDEPDRYDWRDRPAIVEWSTWFRLGYGVESERVTLLGARTTAEPVDQHTTWQTALGADFSLPLGKSVRIGAWGEARGWEPFVGGELLITKAPRDLDMFFYKGEGIWSLRGGVSQEHATAMLGWGYRCPWSLSGPYDRASRYEIGARIVLTGTRALHDPREWTTTLGIEVEPVGALRYLFGIRSWY